MSNPNLLRNFLLTFFAALLLCCTQLYAYEFPQDMKIFKTDDFYAKAWKKVDSLMNKGLPKSALEVVNEIYTRARNEDNSAQVVKAVIHRIMYAAYVEENSLVKNLNDLVKETENAKYPVKPLLHSMIAELYWQYYENNRYRFMNRSTTLDFKQEDIETWDLQKIVEETLNQHLLALKYPEQLKQFKIDVYDEILHKGNSRKLRPTLYDFIAHRAVDFFMNSESDLTKPAYQFTLNNPDYLKDASEFMAMNLTTKDSLSYKFQALKILQDLMKFHEKDGDIAIPIDLDLKRLAYIYTFLTSPAKDKIYLEALQKLEQKSNQFPVSAEVNHYIASLYYIQGQKFNARISDENKWKLKEAYEICQKAIDKFPNSDGAQNCRSLQNQILHKNLKITCEETIPANELSKILIEYKNMPILYWKIVKTDRDEIKRLSRQSYYEEKLIEHFAKKNAAKEWTSTLPDDKDYQIHSLEEKIPALPFGDYILMASDNPKFAYKNNAVAYTYITVSNIAYIHRNNTKDGSMDFYALERNAGTALAGIKAEIWTSDYNYNKGDYQEKKLGDYLSDREGYFKVPYNGNRNNFFVKFFNQSNGDVLNTSERNSYYGNFYQYLNYQEPREAKTFFFTDRAIYRPGQTVYFKGIVLQGNGEKNDIIPDFETIVYLYDVNYQRVAELNLKSNEYGTFSGSFVAPASGLTGQMQLQNFAASSNQKMNHTVVTGETLYKIARQYGTTETNVKKWNNLPDDKIKIGQTILIYQPINSNALGTISFSVEEYKRPKFEVNFEPIKGSFRLNEEITAKGIAKAYSGANIDGAEVKYRVVRRARFPYWWFYWYGYYPTSPEMEITNGTSQSNEKGEFEIKFRAIPDPDVSKESSPVFTYSIMADVTDLNGETRSGSSSVSVAYRALDLSINISGEIDKNEKQEFTISTSNLSGEFEPAKGTISIQALKMPEKAYRSRKWEKPDKFLYSKEDWQKSFPNDLYAEENNFYKWEKENPVLETAFDTEKSKSLLLDKIKSWKQGKYMLEIKAKDKYGEEVKEVVYFTVFGKDEKKLPTPAIDYFANLNYTVEPGQKATLLAGTSDKNILALYEVEHQGKIIDKKWLNLSEEQKVLEIPVKEEYRGNFGVHYTFIKNNRLYSHSVTFNVPRTDKELDISFETFRNKLQPGQEEEWKIRIKGKKGEKVAAEMVAALYDASLDAFRANYWYFNIYNSYYNTLNWGSYGCFDNANFHLYSIDWNKYIYGTSRSYDMLNWYGFSYSNYQYRNRRMLSVTDSAEREENMDEVVVANMATTKKSKAKNGDDPAPPPVEKAENADMDVKTEGQKEDKVTNGKQSKLEDKSKQEDLSGVKARTNFNETAFFYPHLQTDANGDILIKFTIPEALTRWKMLGFAHSKDLKYGMKGNELVTQKDLMVVPNSPRFFRENDAMAFPSKITNISDKDLSGNAQLFLFDALTGKAIDNELGNTNPQQSFQIKAGQSTALNWNMKIPAGVQAITYRVVAKAANFSDGEEMTLPVLTNSMLVTETMPLPIRSNQTKTFTLDKLVASNKSTTLRNEKLTLEFTSNPAWYAVQALPYMMEFPHECAEQLFSRFYANSIASHIANSSPKIKAVFESWKNITPDALLSNLDKNQELKSIIIEETPWLQNANNEGERKRQIGVLFDLIRMSSELEKALNKLIQKQVSSGAWTWFEGMPEDRYITQHIVTGMGHLDNLKVKVVREDAKAWEMTKKAIAYLDRKIEDDYEELKRMEKRGLIKLADNHLGYIQIQYLYARSYFKDLAIEKRHQESFNYFKGQAQKYWLSQNRYMQGMIALGLNRYEDKQTPQAIIKSLKERALYSEEMGMYWKEDYGYYWYQAPIESHALMVEVFDEVANDAKSVDDLKTWMLKQKQTQDWKTTKATAEACYALLLKGQNWLASDRLVEISLGNKKVNPFSEANALPVEAGTGYFKTSWKKDEITADMGKVTVAKKDEGVAWGALYWQYFEQLDKITPAETPLKLKKQLFLEKDSDKGKVIVPIEGKTKLKVGDLVKVRIELRVDRAMEYVHMKDMRAACFEPTNVLSRYKWQDGLGYYESTKDAATHFFMGYLPKGTFVFEYPLRVTHEGDFSNGITSIQCMYAPEFASHSEGVRVKVEKK